MSIRLNPWMRCPCGKLHMRAYVGPNSLCTCGADLYPLAWNTKGQAQ